MKKFTFVFIAILAMITFWFSGLADHFTVDNFSEHKDQLQSYVEDHYIQSILIYMGLYATVVALSLPLASFITLTGGFLFGLVMGTIAVTISATLGATLIFLIAKSSVGEALRDKAGKLYARIEKDMNDNAVGYLLFLRLVPLFPFFLVNIAPALFNIKTRTYIWTTFIGILPGTAVFVNVGKSLGQVENPADLISSETIAAIALLGLFAIIPTLYQKFKKDKKHAKNN
jgi:uncharacterized membrane protein YdjX (TVP38/TMEM64 family)